jgi:predicted dehydrogenase
MNSGKVRFGIVGCGMIADFHRAGIEKSPAAELFAVSDSVPGRAKAFAEKYGAPHAFEDFNAMMRLPELDAVCICTPSGLHAEPAMAAAHAGKSILCEKPLDVTLEKIDALLDAVKRTGVKLGAVFQSRVQPDCLRVKKAVDDGVLGRILQADLRTKWYRSQEYYDSGAWRGTFALDGGGCLMNQGIHGIDLYQWLVGPIRSVYGKVATMNHTIEVEDTAYAICELAGGGRGAIIGSTCAYPGFPTRIEIHGEKGSIVLEDAKIAAWDVMGQEKPADVQIGGGPGVGGAGDPKAISSYGHETLVHDLASAILENRAPKISGAEARVPVAIILAIYQSSHEGRPVEVPYRKQ